MVMIVEQKQIPVKAETEKAPFLIIWFSHQNIIFLQMKRSVIIDMYATELPHFRKIAYLAKTGLQGQVIKFASLRSRPNPTFTHLAPYIICTTRRNYDA